MLDILPLSAGLLSAVYMSAWWSRDAWTEWPVQHLYIALWWLSPLHDQFHFSVGDVRSSKSLVIVQVQVHSGKNYLKWSVRHWVRTL